MSSASPRHGAPGSLQNCVTVYWRAIQPVLSLRRTPYWCIADESYFGTLLSSKLEGMLEGGLTDDIAMAMLRGGDGIYAQDIDLELVRNLSDNNMKCARHWQFAAFGRAVTGAWSKCARSSSRYAAQS